ncbi:MULTISPECIES: DUF6979 family protein [Brevibacillus]|jgi:hypothetical protein|nr:MULTISPECIES: hypothetical protein [Brevibacillus]MBU8712466.1 hypothetical protein [Brevibacillus parabrevis]MDH6349543.1 hypothetical protein [Brevibacillus sp. 1238]MED2257192.1 hypothetical protein [Brevibacillus parabrevis]UED71753.1 hypothetical protein HP435_14350 [Brevibacillus sp. HD3.3A]WDV97987.1 hypothetical protein PSE45_13810 [Brevibacillus parabrevis]
MMGKYGDTALMTMKLVESQEASSPLEAWERASIHMFGAGTASQKKGCPKSAFFGLCEEGFVRGIEPGSYTTSVDNKAYALQAVEWLKKNPSLSPKPTQLWKALHIPKSHNNQMDVVLSLWNHGYIDR